MTDGLQLDTMLADGMVGMLRLQAPSTLVAGFMAHAGQKNQTAVCALVANCVRGQAWLQAALAVVNEEVVSGSSLGTYSFPVCFPLHPPVHGGSLRAP